MIAAICLDDHLGMLFNGRRLSQDRRVRSDLLSHTQGQKLWLNAYSARQFSDSEQESLHVTEDFLDKAPAGSYCFVENEALKPHLDRLEELIIYHWNRVYPSDVRFDLDLSEWKLIDRKEFPGYSHEKITKERYIR